MKPQYEQDVERSRELDRRFVPAEVQLELAKLKQELAEFRYRNLVRRGQAWNVHPEKEYALELLAKLPTEYGPRNLFARDRVVLGSLWWLSLPIWSIFPGATRIDPAAVAASV